MEANPVETIWCEAAATRDDINLYATHNGHKCAEIKLDKDHDCFYCYIFGENSNRQHIEGFGSLSEAKTYAQNLFSRREIELDKTHDRFKGCVFSVVTEGIAGENISFLVTRMETVNALNMDLKWFSNHSRVGEQHLYLPFYTPGYEAGKIVGADDAKVFLMSYLDFIGIDNAMFDLRETTILSPIGGKYGVVGNTKTNTDGWAEQPKWVTDATNKFEGIFIGAMDKFAYTFPQALSRTKEPFATRGRIHMNDIDEKIRLAEMNGVQLSTPFIDPTLHYKELIGDGEFSHYFKHHDQQIER